MEANWIGILYRFLEFYSKEGFTILKLGDPLGGKVEDLRVMCPFVFNYLCELVSLRVDSIEG